MTTETPALSPDHNLGVMMDEAYKLAEAAYNLSEEATEEDENPAREPEELIVPYRTMEDVRYLAKRVLLIVEGFQKLGFPRPAASQSGADNA